MRYLQRALLATCLFAPLALLTACPQTERSSQTVVLQLGTDGYTIYERRSGGPMHAVELQFELFDTLKIEDQEFESEVTQDTSLPDPDAGEFDTIELIIEDGIAYVIEDNKFTMPDAPGDGKPRTRTQIPIRFLTGNWDEYQADRRVSFVYTDEGADLLEATIERETAWMTVFAARAFAEVEGVPFESLAYEGATNASGFENTIFEGTKSKMRANYNQFELRIITQIRMRN